VTKLEQIETDIVRLSPQEYAALAEWFDRRRNLRWDRQIEEDSASGALDFLLQEVDEDIAKGNARPTDELFDNR
jgi:hypothetical protein